MLLGVFLFVVWYPSVIARQPFSAPEAAYQNLDEILAHPQPITIRTYSTGIMQTTLGGIMNLEHEKAQNIADKVIDIPVNVGLVQHQDFGAYLIDAGLDAVNPVQISCRGMDPRILKSEFGERLTFWGGGCDTQKVLPLDTPAGVAEHVREQASILSPGGGFVFQHRTIHTNSAGFHHRLEGVEAADVAFGHNLEDHGGVFFIEDHG